ncbi:hypothetical protein PGT21_001539 [Puccinia graminis f. sp. tritici]|uniref:Uncharacterized protein n=1 Tax=Puccinia graminis f. sp. tritici TaxID=56615 RepID=A0A5B0QVR3_PUCGR|nr:hypothetical protein PGT21_001539 [Puccinia graminis f. sp. tritici]
MSVISLLSFRAILLAWCCFRVTQSMHSVFPLKSDGLDRVEGIRIRTSLKTTTGSRTDLEPSATGDQMAGMQQEFSKMEDASKSGGLSKLEQVKIQSMYDDLDFLRWSIDNFARKYLCKALEKHPDSKISQNLRTHFQDLYNIHELLLNCVKNKMNKLGGKNLITKIPKEIFNPGNIHMSGSITTHSQGHLDLFKPNLPNNGLPLQS